MNTRDAKEHEIITQKPLRYMTEVFRKNHITPLNYDADLRMKPTRLNNFFDQNTQLYGTSPLLLSGYQFPEEEVPKENSLIFSQPTRNVKKYLTEETHFRNQFLDIPLKEDSTLRPISTRASMRNSYRKFNCYKQKI